MSGDTTPSGEEREGQRAVEGLEAAAPRPSSRALRPSASPLTAMNTSDTTGTALAQPLTKQICGLGAGTKGHMTRDDHLRRLLQQSSYVAVNTNCGFGYLNQRQHL